MTGSAATIAVAFVVRADDAGWYASCERFLRSYRQCCAGVAHSLHVIFEGGRNGSALKEAEDLFGSVCHERLWPHDDGVRRGAYMGWANEIDEDVVCVLNTSSEILAADWLRKLAANLALANVGLVGATGSYESRGELGGASAVFPNPHIRLNAFMIDRAVLCRIAKEQVIVDERDIRDLESGPQSLTRQIRDMRRDTLIVGRNGRGYSPKWWPTSDTFQQGKQANLLVADDQTRSFQTARWPDKHELALKSWGSYIREDELL